MEVRFVGFNVFVDGERDALLRATDRGELLLVEPQLVMHVS